MAEILVKIVSATHPNPAKDVYCYKLGDPVVIRENGHPWGAEEFKPPNLGGKFAVVKVPDATAAQVDAFLQSLWGLNLCSEQMDAQKNITRRRACGCTINNVNPPTWNSILSTGIYTTTWTQFQKFILNKATGKTAG